MGRKPRELTAIPCPENAGQLTRACQASSEAGKARSHWQEALALFSDLDAPEADQVRARL
jgi:hypothetical protein